MTTNNIQNLYTFGCSHTYGHGLPDCIVAERQPGPVPSRMGWPDKLSELLGSTLHNISSPGVGPAWCLREFIRVLPDISAADLVVVMWPCWISRVEIFSGPRPDQVRYVRHWDTDHADYFQKYHHLYNSWFNYCNQVYVLNQLACQAGVRVINTSYSTASACKDSPQAELFSTEWPVWMPAYNWSRHHFGDPEFSELPKALDQSHQGLEANALFARVLYTEITDTGAN
jgi:hypothetical protein